MLKTTVKHCKSLAKLGKAQRFFSAMDLRDVVAKLEEIAPTSLAEKWDNVGLLVEPSSPHTVLKIMITNDLTEPVLEETISTKSNLILSYHPPIFRPFKRLTQAQPKERMIVKCIEQRIAVFSPHTSYDSAEAGVNDWLISALGQTQDIAPVQPMDGLSHIGMGRTCLLSQPVTVQQAIQKVKSHINLSHVRLALGNGKSLDSLINSAAVCAGSGSSVLQGHLVDLYLTGEMSHHEVLDATSRGITVILLEHSNSERGFLSIIKDRLQTLLEGKVDIIVSSMDKDPLCTV